MKKSYLAFTIYLIATAVFAGDRLPSLLLSNSWQLSNTNIGKPEKINIDGHNATFKNDGTWTYVTILSGPFTGMEMNGKGTWRIVDSTLIYTAGNKKGKSKISIENGILKLNPDPVLAFDGNDALETTYVIKK